jgi:hypothetical protein
MSIPRVRGRSDLKRLFKEMQDGVGRSKVSLRRKRKIAQSAKIMTLVDLDNKLAALRWAEQMADTMPEGIELNENGEKL